jgi:hypothetical protein
MNHESEPELNHYLDLFDDFSEQEAAQLALGFRKIHTKKIMSVAHEEKILIYNQKYQYKFGPQGSDKPISKIIE